LQGERQLLPRPDVDVLGMRLAAALRNLTFIAVRRRRRPVTAPDPSELALPTPCRR
jgi:hypothetical protein